MERVFCENCGRERRAVEAVGAYEGTPYCEPCKKLDEIPEQDFVRFGVQGVASDAGSRSQVATPEALPPAVGVDITQSLLRDAKHRCVGCGTVVRVRFGTPPRKQCRKCEQKAKKAPAMFGGDKAAATTDRTAAGSAVAVIKHPANRVVIGKICGKPAKAAALALLSDDDYQKLRPNTGDHDLFQKLLITVGDRKNHPCRVKLDYARRDLKNFANRVRRVLRLNHKQDASSSKSVCGSRWARPATWAVLGDAAHRF